MIPNETARLELYFDAGTIKAEGGIPSFVNNLIFSGNAEKSAQEINNELDFLGAYYDSGVSTETANVGLYGLRDNFPQIVDIVFDALNRMDCQEKEVEEVVADRYQNFLVNMEKTKFLAQSRIFKERFLLLQRLILK